MFNITKLRLLIVPFLFSLVIQSQTIQPAIVILQVNGSINYARSSWSVEQELSPGAIINANDIIFPLSASLLVMCPDGRTRNFLEAELFPNDIIRCEADPADFIIGTTGSLRVRIQRGGRQDFSVPYLISPRATAVRHPMVDLVWNPVLNAQFYTLTLTSGSVIVWESGLLDATQVTQGSIAWAALPVELEANTSYMLEICVAFTDLQRMCTTDPGASADVDTAFRYIPSPLVDERLQQLVDDLGSDSAEALYAQAILLGQPVSGDNLQAYYNEAITLLEDLLAKHPDSDLATSAEIYTQLGTLYQAVYLPLNATRAYNQALELANPATEVAAKAAIGRASTTVAGDEIDFYNLALESYASFLSEPSFLEEFRGICRSIGDICNDLHLCTMPEADCDTWSSSGG